MLVVLKKLHMSIVQCNKPETLVNEDVQNEKLILKFNYMVYRPDNCWQHKSKIFQIGHSK